MLIFCFLLGSLFSETLVITTSSTEVELLLLTALCGEIFSRLGTNVEIRPMPAERSLLNANAGLSDGEGLRVGELSVLYPNLIQVPEVFFVTEFSVITRDHNLRINDWNSVASYTVGYVVGWKIVEAHLPDTCSAVPIPSYQSLFQMLSLGRIDVAVYSKMDALYLLQNSKYSDLIVLEPSLAKEEMFLYLYKSHSDLVPQVQEVLREMKADGTYQKIMDQSFGG